MHRIELTHENIDLIREILSSRLSELRMEIAPPARGDFRGFLRNRGDILDRFLHDLEREEAAA